MNWCFSTSVWEKAQTHLDLWNTEHVGQTQASTPFGPIMVLWIPQSLPPSPNHVCSRSSQKNESSELCQPFWGCWIHPMSDSCKIGISRAHSSSTRKCLYKSQGARSCSLRYPGTKLQMLWGIEANKMLDSDENMSKRWLKAFKSICEESY